jgi:hypothetical protein
MKADFTAIIQDWFSGFGGGGLVLPDGWFGRPHDNLHRLTFIASRPSWLIIELDEQFLLTIRDAKVVARENRDLVISGFASCTFDWKEYGDTRGHVTHYDHGEVRLVPPPRA